MGYRATHQPTDKSVGWPSGQRQQTVNLPTFVYVGSNPTPTTTLSTMSHTSLSRAGVA